MITLPDADQINLAIREAEAMTAYRWACAAAADELFDPTTNPKMWARANAIVRNLHTSHDLRYVDHAPDGMKPFDEHDPGQQAATFVHYVRESDTVHVARDGRTARGWSWLHRKRWPVDACDINEAVDCGRADQQTVYLTLTRPPYVLAFEACFACFHHLRDIAVTGQIVGEADARIAFDAAIEAAMARWPAVQGDAPC